MPTNYPGPFELRFNYTTAVAGQATLQHQFRISSVAASEGNPGDPLENWDFIQRNGVNVDAQTWADAVVAVVKTIFDANTDFTDVELWEYTPGTFDAAFRTVSSLAVVGTSGGSGAIDGQAIITFRSQLGGSARMDLRRPVIIPGVTQSFPTSVAAINNIAALMTGVTSCAVARDGGYLFAALNYLPGTNERMFKDRLRP